MGGRAVFAAGHLPLNCACWNMPLSCAVYCTLMSASSLPLPRPHPTGPPRAALCRFVKRAMHGTRMLSPAEVRHPAVPGPLACDLQLRMHAGGILVAEFGHAHTILPSFHKPDRPLRLPPTRARCHQLA